MKSERKLMSTDLTNSNNIAKTLFFFSMPMILGNLLQQFYNIIDTWVVGKYIGAQALASVGASYTLMTFLNSVFIGLCMGSGAIFAYYFGQKDLNKMKNCMDTAFVFIGGITLILTIVVRLCLPLIIRLLNIPGELQKMTGNYLEIICVGIFFIFLFNYYAYVLRSIGNSVVPLIFLAIASLLNIVLDLWFVLGLKWDLKGAAIATVTAQAFSGIGLGIYTYIKRADLRFSIKSFIGKEKPLKEIIQFSMVTCGQQSVMNFGILMIQGLVNSFGTSVMAAFAAAVKIDTLAYMPAQEFGNAYSMFISQNFGAGKLKRIKRGTKSAFVMSVSFCALLSIFVFIFAKSLMAIFVSGAEADIINIGNSYLKIEGACYIGIGVLFLLYGYFRGVNRPMVSFVLTMISLGTRVVLAYVLAAVDVIGVYGIWWAIPIGWLLADMVGIYIMKKRRIQKNKMSNQLN